jgi:hypothetical protein
LVVLGRLLLHAVRGLPSRGRCAVLWDWRVD